MPRRKQDCPKRMKWEEGASSGTCDRVAKDGDYRGDVTENESGGDGGGAADVSVSMGSSKERGGGSEDEEESSSNGEEEEEDNEDDGESGSKRLRMVRVVGVPGAVGGMMESTAKVTVSVDQLTSNIDNSSNTVTEDVVATEEEEDEEPPTEVKACRDNNNIAAVVTASQVTVEVDRALKDNNIALFHRVLTPTPPSLPLVVSPTICIPHPTSLPVNVTMSHVEIPNVKGGKETDDNVHSSDNDETQDGPLDFSFKKKPASPKQAATPSVARSNTKDDTVTDDGPLDLSVSSSRKRPRCEQLEANNSGHMGILQHVNAHLGHMAGHRNKSLRLDSGNAGNSGGNSAVKPSSPWSNQFPFRFSPSSSPNSGVEVPMWNGGVKSTGSRSTPSPSTQQHNCNTAAAAAAATTANHYQSSSEHQQHQQQRHHSSSTPLRDSSPVTGHHHHHHHKSSTPLSNSSGSGRHNAWQSHWLSRGADQAKDVLKCVWCRKSFRSLEEMTTHMKEARHCGMHMPHQTSLPPPLPPPPPPRELKSGGNSSTVSSISSAVVGTGGGGSKKANGDEQQSTVLMKDQPPQQQQSSAAASLPMPRKLVRGQDVWLGKGAEQTKQILKCMWCGQSFKSLAEMTTHMQQTQHYTNIISQEQIISWKSPEDKMAASGQAHVNAVLTCKVCDQAFSSLKELSNHMVKNSHYKEHILRSITENGGRRRQTREKRKKSLPVRKLLELERAQNEMNRMQNPDGEPPPPTTIHQQSVGGTRGGSLASSKSTSSSTAADNGRITCEKCGRKIDTQAFVDHIRQCVGTGSTMASLSNLIASVSPKRSCSPRKAESSSSPRLHKQHSYASPILQPSPTPSESNGQLIMDNSGSAATSAGGQNEAPSVLNAIERLIEKSFDGKQGRGGRHQQTYVTNAPGSNRTTPSTPSAPTTGQQTTDLSKVDEDERRAAKSESETEDDDDEEDFVKDNSYQKLVIDEGNGGGHARRYATKADDPIDGCKELIERKRKRRKSRRRSSINRLSSPVDVMDNRLTTVRASPLSTCSKRDASSPARSVDSPGSCSNCSSHGTIVSVHGGGNITGGGLSLVRSTPSPSSPTCSADHPLKELQKLLDKTNVSLSKSSSASTVTLRGDALSPNVTTTSPSGVATLSYSSWANNAAVSGGGGGGETGSDVISCNFCDNSFVSRSAFRHHVAKVHAGAARHHHQHMVTSSASNSASSSTTVTPLNMATSGCTRISSPSASSSSSTSSSSANSPPNNTTNNNNNNLCKSPCKSPANTSSAPTTASTAPAHDNESPHSKFLKYTELAKQLSSKYV